jgi:dTDP-4-dehydrorhamnose 3,5-epimerase
MKILDTSLPGVLLIQPRVFRDGRGRFLETYHAERYAAGGIGARFVQDNLSCSARGTLRGLHFQHPRGQAKLVQVISGRVFDVALDIRQGSPTFGCWAGFELDGEQGHQLFIPAGFAHGFCVLSAEAVFHYKCSDLYAPECEGGVLWCDARIGIQWPVSEPLLSAKDRCNPLLEAIPAERLPRWSDLA